MSKPVCLGLGLLAGANAIPALVPNTLGPESGDVLSGKANEYKMCGAYGDPHVFKADGHLKNFMGQGEYQLFASPHLNTEVHYYGCGKVAKKVKNAGFAAGVYMGGLAMKIGTVNIEIIGNSLHVIGGEKYEINYYNDKPLGPFIHKAGSTTVTILREAITTDDLWKAQATDRGREAKGKMLYRWTISTTDGVSIHSHASKVAVSQSGWVIDFHINYPKERNNANKGLCIDKCDVFTKADNNCGASTSCHPINASATYGVSPLFSEVGLSELKEACPHTEIDKTCPPRSATGPEMCELTNSTLHDAMLACIHLSEMHDKGYHDACVYDYCSIGDGAEHATEAWYKEHNPPKDLKCKAVEDPRFQTFEDYDMSFSGEGVYSVLQKDAGGETDPCAVDIQMKECPGTGSNVTKKPHSFMSAIGVKAAGGENNHTIIFENDKCTWAGKACGTTVGENVGSDGVTLIPYIPAKGAEAMGDFGPGEFGWYVYSMGFSINVTVTKPSSASGLTGMHGQAPYMMNVIAKGPEMCTAKAEGLCTKSASNADKALQLFAEDALARRTEAAEMAEAEEQGVVLTKKPAKNLVSYPAMEQANIMTGLGGLTCPN
jgi:hypothetical protein